MKSVIEDFSESEEEDVMKELEHFKRKLEREQREWQEDQEYQMN